MPILLLLLALAPEGDRKTGEIAALRDANRLVAELYAEREFTYPVPANLGPMPKARPTGTMKLELVGESGLSYHLTYSVTIPEGGENHFRVELVKASGKQGNKYRRRGYSRSGSTLPVGTTTKATRRPVNTGVPQLLVLLVRSSKTREHYILDVIQDPLKEKNAADADDQ